MIVSWLSGHSLQLRILTLAAGNEWFSRVADLATFGSLIIIAAFLLYSPLSTPVRRLFATILCASGMLQLLNFWRTPESLPTGFFIAGIAVPILFLTGIVVFIVKRRKSSHDDLPHSLEAAQGALLREKNLLAALVDNLPDAIYFKDLQSRFIRCNQKVADGFQLQSPSEAIGKCDHDFFSREEADVYLADEQYIIETGQPIINKEQHEKWHDNKYHWVLSTKLPLRDSDQNIIGTFGLSRDISELKLAETRLKLKVEELQAWHARYVQEQGLLSALIDGIPDAVFFKDRESRFTRVNSAIAAEAGFTSPAEMIGLTDADIWSSEVAAEALADERRIMKTGEPIISKQECVVRKSDGETRWVLATKMPLRDPDGNILGTFGVAHDITMLKVTQQWLSDSQERFELAVLGSSDGLWDWNVQNDEVWYASRFRELLGFEVMDDFPSLLSSMTERLHPDDKDRVMSALHGHLDDHTPYDEEYRLRTASGDYRWYRSRGQATWDETGQPIRMAGSIQDVHENHKTQQQLARTKLQLEQTMIGGNVGMWDWNIETNRIEVSPELMAQLGHDMTNPWTSLDDWERSLHPDDLDAAKMRVSDYMNGRSDEYESSFRLRHADGDYRWFLSRGRLFRNEDGQPGRFIGAHIDISELRDAQQALVESEDRFRWIFNQSFQFIGLMTPDGTLIDANRSALQAAGIEDSEVLGRKFWETLWWSHSPALQRRLQQAVVKAAAGGFDRFEAAHPGPDGSTIHVDFSLKPAHDEHGEVVYLIPEGRDISELKKFEDELRSRTEELEQSNQELEQFAYIASHDLQEPLRTIVGFCQLLEIEYQSSLGETGKSYLQTIVDGGKRMQQLINDLLEYSRVGRRGSPLELQPLGAIIEEVRALLHTAITESHTTFEIGELPDIYADSGQMIRTFQNLIENAIKYRREKPPHIKIWAEQVDDHWNIYVNDNGVGIPEQFSEQVFIIFKRLHTQEEFVGTGIGLAICRRIIERHNGTIQLVHPQGSESSGCTFQIVLPRTPVPV